MMLQHPFHKVEGGNAEWDYDVPMLPGDHVTNDAGTGFVHTAPSHGDGVSLYLQARIKRPSRSAKPQSRISFFL